MKLRCVIPDIATSDLTRNEIYEAHDEDWNDNADLVFVVNDRQIKAGYFKYRFVPAIANNFEEALYSKLFPKNNETISGMSWNGFALVGNEKSIAELRRIQHAASQIEEYREAFKQREKDYKSQIKELTSEVEELTKVSARLARFKAQVREKLKEISKL